MRERGGCGREGGREGEAEREGTMNRERESGQIESPIYGPNGSLVQDSVGQVPAAELPCLKVVGAERGRDEERKREIETERRKQLMLGKDKDSVGRPPFSSSPLLLSSLELSDTGVFVRIAHSSTTLSVRPT